MCRQWLPITESSGMSLYGSSKAAINLLTKSWAAEYGPHRCPRECS